MHVIKTNLNIFIATLIAVIIGRSIPATATPYSLLNSPWDDKTGTICESKTNTDLRAFIFDAEFRAAIQPTPSATSKELINIPAYTRSDGIFVESTWKIREVPYLIRTLVYRYMETQSVGYLNLSNEWVDANNRPVKTFEGFQTIRNQKDTNSTPNNKIEYTSEYEMNDFQIQDLLEKTPKCSYIKNRAFYKQFVGPLPFDPENYNKFSCGVDGLAYKTPLDLPKFTNLKIANSEDTRYFYVDGDGQYGSGDIHAFAKADRQNSQGEYCDWKEIRE